MDSTVLFPHKILRNNFIFNFNPSRNENGTGTEQSSEIRASQLNLDVRTLHDQYDKITDRFIYFYICTMYIGKHSQGGVYRKVLNRRRASIQDTKNFMQ